jgi:hypothetical protein
MEEQTNQHVAEIKVEKDQTEQTEQPEESQANAENSAKAKAAFDESVKNAYRSAMGSLLELADDLNREANIFIDASLLEEEIDRVHRVTGFARIPAIFSKLEILLGLAAIWCSFSITDVGDHEMVKRCLLFVFGGYLTLAGHRSHLYRAMNKLTAYLHLK